MFLLLKSRVMVRCICSLRHKEAIPYVCSRSCSPSRCRGSSRSPARSGRTSVPRLRACRSTARWLDHTCPCRSRRRCTDRCLRKDRATRVSLLTSAASDEISAKTSMLFFFHLCSSNSEKLLSLRSSQHLNTAYYGGYSVLKIYAKLKCWLSPIPQIKRWIKCA